MLLAQDQRRQWHPTPVLLPGKSHRRRNLVGCSPWGRQELDTTERFHFDFSLSCIGGRNGNPLQCSCLENPMDRGAWWAAVYGVAESDTTEATQQQQQQQPRTTLWKPVLQNKVFHQLLISVAKKRISRPYTIILSLKFICPLAKLKAPVQFSSVTQSCPTLCNPMNYSTPGLPVHQQLPEFTQTHVH